MTSTPLPDEQDLDEQAADVQLSVSSDLSLQRRRKAKHWLSGLGAVLLVASAVAIGAVIGSSAAQQQPTAAVPNVVLNEGGSQITVDADGVETTTDGRVVSVAAAKKINALSSTLSDAAFTSMEMLQLSSPKTGHFASLKVNAAVRYDKRGSRCGTIVVIFTDLGDVTLDGTDMYFEERITDTLAEAGFAIAEFDVTNFQRHRLLMQSNTAVVLMGIFNAVADLQDARCNEMANNVVDYNGLRDGPLPDLPGGDFSIRLTEYTECDMTQDTGSFCATKQGVAAHPTDFPGMLFYKAERNIEVINGHIAGNNSLSWDLESRVQRSLVMNDMAYNWEVTPEGDKVNCFAHDMSKNKGAAKGLQFEDVGHYYGSDFMVNGYAARKFILRVRATDTTPALDVEVYDRRSDNKLLRLIIQAADDVDTKRGTEQLPLKISDVYELTFTRDGVPPCEKSETGSCEQWATPSFNSCINYGDVGIQDKEIAPVPITINPPQFALPKENAAADPIDDTLPTFSTAQDPGSSGSYSAGDAKSFGSYSAGDADTLRKLVVKAEEVVASNVGASITDHSAYICPPSSHFEFPKLFEYYECHKTAAGERMFAFEAETPNPFPNPAMGIVLGGKIEFELTPDYAKGYGCISVGAKTTSWDLASAEICGTAKYPAECDYELAILGTIMIGDGYWYGIGAEFEYTYKAKDSSECQNTFTIKIVACLVGYEVKFQVYPVIAAAETTSQKSECKCEDDTTFKDKNGNYCSAWEGYNCDTYSGYVPAEMTQIRSKCRGSCKSCDCSCKDDLGFKDAKGYYCSSWAGYKCDSYDGYTKQDMFKVKTNCLEACGQCRRLLETGKAVNHFTKHGMGVTPRPSEFREAL